MSMKVADDEEKTEKVRVISRELLSLVDCLMWKIGKF